MVVQLQNFKNIFLVPELRRKLAFTFIVLAVFRFGQHIPLPGIDPARLVQLMQGAAGSILGYLDVVAGGALRKFAIFALGIGPYISASIMIQLLTVMVPTLEALSKEGEYGRRIINQYTRYLTLGLAFLQGFGYTFLAENMGLAIYPGWGFRLTSVLILCVGAMFVMWLGEQITAHGVGNGSSILIFGSIVAGLPVAIAKLLSEIKLGQIAPMIGIALLGIGIAVIMCVVFLEKGERRIPVHYAKRVVGNRVYGGQSSYIPLKINISGVIPVIFAGTIIQMPMMVVRLLANRFPALSGLQDMLMPTEILYNVLLIGLIVFFAFFYTAIIFNPVELAENMRKSGGFIPGIRPGKRTSEFFDYVLTRVGLPGAMYLSFLAVIPNILAGFFRFPSAYVFSGLSMLIAVGVALDTSAKIESYLIERRYDGFLTSGRLRGRGNR